MADLKDEIKLVANADGVETGVSRAKRSLATLGQAVDQVGEQGEKGFKRFGAGSDEAGRRIDSTTKGMVSSLQRQIAALEAGGTATRQYQESIARLRGADMNVLKPYLDQLDAAKTKAEGAAKANQGMEKSMGTLGTAAGFLRAQMVALVGSFTFAAGVAYVRQMTDALDALNDVKDATGSTIENISALENVAMRTGTTLDVVTTSMVKLNEVLNKAKPGSDQALALKAIGLEAEELRKLDPAEALRRVAVALSEYADDGNKARLVQGFFSKSIREMAPFLADLAEQTQLVGKVTSEQTAEAEKFNKQLFELKTRSAEAGRAMVSGMLPGLNQIAEAMNRGAKEGGLLLGVYRAIAEFGSIAFGTDKLGKELSAAKDYQAEMARLSRLLQGPLLIQERDPQNDANNRRVASLRAQLEAVQKKALQATDAIKGLVDPPKPPEPPEKPSVVAPEDAATLNAAAADALAARLQAYKNNDKAILDSRKAFYDTLALLTKVGAKSDIDAAEESIAKEAEVWTLRKANFDAELAEASKKKNSQAEIARITGQMQDAERDYFQTVAKLRADATIAEQKYSDELSDRIKKQLAAAGAAQEQVRLAQLEGKAIGLTGDALREHNQLQVEDKARRLEALALWASGVDASGKLAQAYLDEAAALRKLHTEQGANRSAQLVNEYVKGIADSNKLLQAEIGLMGLSEQARNTALEQLRIQLDLEKKIAEVKALEGDTPERAARIAQLEAGAAIAKANAANKAFLDEWKQSVNKYDDIFRQGFADMLNNGKDGWKSFTRSLATTFKTTVADQLYKAFAQPFVVNIVGNLLGLTGALGLGGATGAAQGVLGGVSGLASGANVLTGLQGTTGILGNIGTFLGTNTVATNTAIATSLGIDAASASAAATGASAAGGGALGGLLSNPITMGLGAIAALSLLSKLGKGETRTGGQFGVAFDGSVTNQRRGQTYTIEGQQFDRDFTNGLQTALKDGIAYRLEGDPVAQESAIREAVAGTASGINGFLKALGSAATLTGFSAGLETSGKGRGGVFAGGLLSTGAAFGESGKGDNYAGTLYEAFSTNSPDFKTALENFTLDLKQSTIQALQTVSDIPQAVQKMLQGVDAEALTEDAANKLLETINAQIVGVENLRTSFENIGLDKLAEMSFDAASGLAAAAGGFDALQGKLATYYDAFYTEEEKRANTIRQITKTLRDAGAQVTADDVGKATREQFRAIYESIVDVGGAADPVAVALLNVAGAFASVTPAAADAANAAKELADSQAADAARRAQEVARERYDIETELYNLLGDTNKLRERELATIDASNRSLKEFVYSLQDAFSAVDDAFGTVQRSVAAQKEALQTEFNAGQKQRQQAQSDAQATSSLIDGIIKAITNALGAQTIESQAFDNMRRAQAQAQLDNFLASVMGGGSVADLPGLDRTLGTLGKDSRAGFGTFEDYAFDRGVTAGKLAELGALADAQKSVAEKTLEQITAGNEAAQTAFDAQIATLDATLTTAQGLLDAVNGVDTSVMGVAEAMDRFSETLINLEEIRSARSVQRALMQQGSGESAGGSGREYTDAELAALGFDPADIRAYAQQAANAGLSSARGGLEGVINEIIGAGQQAIDTAMGLNLTGGTTTKYGSYSDMAAYMSQFTDAQRVAASEAYTNGGANGVSSAELQAILSGIGAAAQSQTYSASNSLTLEDFLKKVPQYEQGTPYVPNDGLAFLHKGEQVIPAQYNNPVSMLQSGGASNAEIAAALRAMAARLDAIEANTRAAAGHAAGTDQRLSRVIDNDAFRTRETA